MNNYIEKGDRIQCPECGAIIGVFNTKPTLGTPCKTSIVDFEDGMKCTRFNCNSCGGFFANGTIAITVFHIKGKGWVGAR